MAEDNRLASSPVLVENFQAVFGCDGGHVPSFEMGIERHSLNHIPVNGNSTGLPAIPPSARSRNPLQPLAEVLLPAFRQCCNAQRPLHRGHFSPAVPFLPVP